MRRREREGRTIAAAVPLVLTKLHLPLLKSNTLPREHLSSLLQQAVEYRLTLVCAGVGYGKTTFLGHALKSLDTPFIWYALNRSDRDIITFLSYLIEGINRQWPGFAAALPPGLLPSPNRQLELNEFMATFINKLAEFAGANSLIVLDDFHLVEVNPEVHQAINYLLQHAPHRIHFILSTRSIPSLPCLARLRARGEVLEIDERYLKFTPNDVASLFSRSFNLQLPFRVTTMLTEQTEGWALGLRLVEQSIKGQGANSAADIVAGLKSFYTPLDPRPHPPLKNGLEVAGLAVKRRVLFEYLTEEILGNQPASIADFLTSSAILSWLEPSVCDATLGRSDSDTILRYLEQHNLFVIRTADGWLRYHRLFREFLYHHLIQDRERFETLHGRAATYFEEKRDLERAIHHRLEAGDYSHGAKLMEQMSREMLQAGRFDTLSFWIAQLPPSLLERYPKLLLCQGQIHERHGRWEQAMERYEAAAQVYIASDDLVSLSDALSKKGQILDWWRGEHARAKRLHYEALSYLGQEHTRKRAALLRNLSRNQLSAGNSEAALAHYQEALQMYEAEGDREGELATRINPGSWLYHSTGDFSRALMTLRRAERLAHDLGNRGYLAEIYNNFSVNLHFLWRNDEAQAYAEKALALSREIGDGHNEAYAMMNQANVMGTARGISPSSLYRQYQKILRIEQAEGDYRFAIATLVFMSIFLRRSGLPDEAVRRGQQALPLTTEQDLRWLTGFVLLNLGAAQIEVNPEGALGSLKEALKIAMHCQDVYHLVAAHFWLTTRYYRENNPLYLNHLNECLRLAVRHNLDYFFRSEAQTTVTLLVTALAHNLWPSYATQILTEIGEGTAAGLQPRLSHPDHEVRPRAQKVLGQSNGRSAPLPLVQLPATPRLTIHCFGHFRVQQGETWLPETAWRRRKSKRLLKYVILSPNHVMAKDQLVDRLWNDLSPSAANSNFYRTLYNIRRVLEPQGPRSHSSYLVLAGGLLRLAEGVVQRVDVNDFTAEMEAARRALQQGDDTAARRNFERAVSLYSGDLFTDDLYDDWVQPQRQYLRNQYLRALTGLANLAAQANHYEQAADYLQKILNLDPSQEGICIKLMDYLVRTGRRTEALRYAVVCEKGLAELGVSPSTELAVFKEMLI